MANGAFRPEAVSQPIMLAAAISGVRGRNDGEGVLFINQSAGNECNRYRQLGTDLCAVGLTLTGRRFREDTRGR